MSANQERARGLMTDIETWNPQYARQLTRQHGRKGALKILEKILDENDKMKRALEQEILNQMPKVHDPYKRMTQEAQAHELASELAYEEIRALYSPQQESTEDAENLLQMLRL